MSKPESKPEPIKTCKLSPTVKYDPDWCAEVGGKARQCQSCGNKPEAEK